MCFETTLEKKEKTNTQTILTKLNTQQISWLAVVLQAVYKVKHKLNFFLKLL